MGGGRRKAASAWLGRLSYPFYNAASFFTLLFARLAWRCPVGEGQLLRQDGAMAAGVRQAESVRIRHPSPACNEILEVVRAFSGYQKGTAPIPHPSSRPRTHLPQLGISPVIRFQQRLDVMLYTARCNAGKLANQSWTQDKTTIFAHSKGTRVVTDVITIVLVPKDRDVVNLDRIRAAAATGGPRMHRIPARRAGSLNCRISGSIDTVYFFVSLRFVHRHRRHTAQSTSTLLPPFAPTQPNPTQPAQATRAA